MGQARTREDHRAPADPRNDGSRSDLATSRLPGGPGSIEQEPARANHAGRAPISRSDPEIRDEIADWLPQQDQFDSTEIQVLVREGIVMLLGTVPDRESKRSIENFVLGVRGVRELHDQLLVASERPTIEPGGLRSEAPHARVSGH